MVANARDIGSVSLDPISISVRPISQFRIGRDDRNFGPLEFVGGLEMTASSRHFGAISSLRFLSPGAEFIGVADTGFWFFGTLTHDAEQRPSGVENFSMEQMVDETGKAFARKWEVDAESLAVRDGVATVGFERNHRVARFRIERGNMGPAIGAVDFVIPSKELRQNRGLETVAFAPSGRLVVVSEKSLDLNGNIYAAIADGPQRGVFTVKRNGEFDITDGAFLPGGDLILLERSFNMAEGVKMRLRRIVGSDIVKGAIADGTVLLEADMAYQIDNMEALDIWTRADGAVMVSLMSDDNHSILQRNLYLEFVLHE
nr:esterase-like activity of phytase family protein [Mesorhizobium sp. NBSH29]